MLDDDLQPAPRRRRRQARPPRPHPARLLQGPGEDGGDVPRGRRRALVGPRRPCPHRGRRHDHAARPRLGVDQHRRREGVPRRGRGARSRRHPDVFDAVVVGVPDERWGERVVARGRSPAPAREPTLEDLDRARAHARRRATRCRATSCSSTTIVRSPSGKPDYRWAQGHRHRAARHDRVAMRDVLLTVLLGSVRRDGRRIVHRATVLSSAAYDRQAAHPAPPSGVRPSTLRDLGSPPARPSSRPDSLDAARTSRAATGRPGPATLIAECTARWRGRRRNGSEVCDRFEARRATPVDSQTLRPSRRLDAPGPRSRRRSQPARAVAAAGVVHLDVAAGDALLHAGRRRRR